MESERINWIYEGVSGLIDKEEYLTGRKVDKTFEIALAEQNGEISNDFSIKDKYILSLFNSKNNLDSNLNEDPLLQIKKRKTEIIKDFLNNPLKMKRIKENEKDLKPIIKQLKKRGPDSFKEIQINLNDIFKAKISSSVLSLRGDFLVQQPIISLENDIFQWNGEVYESNLSILFGNMKNNDSLVLSNLLLKCNSELEISIVLSSIKGEFSFTYWKNDLKILFFGRDFFGRRSLCWNFKSNINFEELKEKHVAKIGKFSKDLIICSTAFFQDYEYFEEIPAYGFYKIFFDKKSEHYLNINLVKYNFIKKSICENFNLDLCSSLNTNEFNLHVSNFLKYLENSIKLRIDLLIPKCVFCFKKKSIKCFHSYLGILFSGGIDSTLIALLADKFVNKENSIDLLNLSFHEFAPDRITGLSSFNELLKLRPNRKWNFVKIDSNLEELVFYREKYIKNLIYPLKTVLDDSIGCAIWFASRANGTLLNINLLNEELYKSPVRVLLLGMGADEQLGGYSRHRTTFKNNGLFALQNQLIFDIERISSRNLGRDDRIVSYHGREARYPYLDENLVNFLNNLPINVKCDLNLSKGIGDKKLLRAAAIKLGLNKCSFFEKKAIQFGTKISKLESKNEKANHTCKRLIN